jgi:hypothetical protein
MDMQLLIINNIEQSKEDRWWSYYKKKLMSDNKLGWNDIHIVKLIGQKMVDDIEYCSLFWCHFVTGAYIHSHDLSIKGTNLSLTYYPCSPPIDNTILKDKSLQC